MLRDLPAAKLVESRAGQEDAPARVDVFQPTLGDDELVAVRAVFASSWVGRGPVTDRFEAEFAGHLGVPRPLVGSVSCCTEGLFQSMALLDVGPGDEVVLPTISFVGAANAVAACRATPVFCDVDRRTLMATARAIEAALSPRTKVIVLLHYAGRPSRMDEILPLLEEHRVALVEDCACAVASRFRGQACGTFGDVGVWSFDAMKILVTGDGGMVYCRRPEAAERLARSVYLGLDQPNSLGSTKESRWWEFEVSTFGRRAILNDVAASIGLVQLGKLEGFVARRRAIHERYDRELDRLGWLCTPPPFPAENESSYYLYWIQVDPSHRDRLATFLRRRGIYTTFRYHPLHRVALYGAAGSFPEADAAAESTLCLPLHQGLSEDDVGRVVEGVRAYGATL